jgi:hypothetical protein
MLDFQNTKRAVFSPGTDSHYFDGLALASTPFQITSAYSQTNAWWLAELSRIVYRHSATEDGFVLPDRKTVLQSAGLQETAFFSKGATQASIISGGTFHVLAFRGTERLDDWLRNVEVAPASWSGGGKVHSGFLRALDEVWKPVAAALRSIHGPAFFTGHSLGGAIAVLAAARVSAAHRPLAVYTYGAPSCGNRTFAHEHPLRDRIYRVVNNRDVVPHSLPGYMHTGELHYITSDKRLLTNPKPKDMIFDHFRDDDTHSLPRDLMPEQITDHAPVNYVAWMQRFANPEWVRKFGG